jgi:DNA-binding transcriptional ArsR family regulator
MPVSQDQQTELPLATRKQVFIAYSYKLYPKADYRKLYKDLEARYEVTFIFADEKITNMHIMKKIETLIRGSDFSVFDISGWNPNVTLELGFAMAVGDQWYIAIDPSKTEIKEVPSDLRGLDRIEYGSYDELGSKLSILLEQRYPRRAHTGIDSFLADRRAEVLKLLAEHPGLTVTSLAQLLSIEIPVAQLVVKPLLAEGKLDTVGVKKATKYYIAGTAPRDAGQRSRRERRGRPTRS